MAPEQPLQRLVTIVLLGVATGRAGLGNAGLSWPCQSDRVHCDSLIWPHLRHAGAVL